MPTDTTLPSEDDIIDEDFDDEDDDDDEDEDDDDDWSESSNPDHGLDEED